MKMPIIVLACLLAAGPCLAQEPVGCDKFKWPLDREHAMLDATAIPSLASGGSLAQALPAVTAVALVPFADAKLPMAPQRLPQTPNSFAGFVNVAAPPRDGSYKISLSAGAWIDVVQTGRLLKSTAFSGATGCANLRKSVKFDLTAQPFVVELSGVRSNSIRMAISAD